jgi:hypothetical protein
VALNIEEIQKLVPEYETDLSAVGENRRAVDPDGDRHWYEVHGLTPQDAEDMS